MNHQTETPINASMTIRRMDLREEDRAPLARLAELDSNRPLEGPVLGVEVEGRLLAAISLATGETIADPFSRTRELTELLRTRSVQIRRRARKDKRRRSRDAGGHPAVAGGSAGRIATLPRWG
jgi:hypothetical protein